MKDVKNVKTKLTIRPSSPYCGSLHLTFWRFTNRIIIIIIIWRRYCCLTAFFPIVDTCLICEDIARQSCTMVRRWRLFRDFLRPAFPASRVQHVSDLHPKFALRAKATPCVEVWQTSNLRPLRLGEEKRKNKRQDENIIYVCLLHRATIN